ncbi:MAG: hypothetical protein N4A53_09955 [Pelagimonas sp.]|jgi:hypothetical protein|nr:hypothetical protein [Pelagimonas sp.]
MAIFGFLLGSILGFVVGFVGWAFFGISLFAALSIYLSLGIGTGLTLAILRAEDDTLYPPSPMAAASL